MENKNAQRARLDWPNGETETVEFLGMEGTMAHVKRIEFDDEEIKISASRLTFLAVKKGEGPGA